MHLSEATYIAFISSCIPWKSNPWPWHCYLGEFTYCLRTTNLHLYGFKLSGCPQLIFWHLTFPKVNKQTNYNMPVNLFHLQYYVSVVYHSLWLLCDIKMIRAHLRLDAMIAEISSLLLEDRICVSSSPSCAGRGVASVEGSSELAGLEDRVWLLLLLISLQKTADWLLLELGTASGEQSSSGCFFCMSDEENRESVRVSQTHWFKYNRNYIDHVMKVTYLQNI